MRIDDAELDEIADAVEALADRFEGGTPRIKFDDMMTRPHLARIYSGEHTPLQIEIGDDIEFDPFSMAGGHLHPSSIGLRYTRDGQTSVRGTGVVDGMFAGPPERIHGGIQALIVDEVMGSLNRMLGRQAFTARLSVNLRAPAPIDTEVTFRSWVDNVDGRKITLLCEGSGPDGLFLDAEGLFIARPDGEPILPERP